MGDRQVERFFEKSAKLVFGHFSGGHWEFAVSLRAFAAHMTIDPHILRRVSKDGRGLLRAEERAIGMRVQRAPTEKAVMIKNLKVAGL